MPKTITLEKGDLYYDNPRKLLCRVEGRLTSKGELIGYHLIPKTKTIYGPAGYFMLFGEENICIPLTNPITNNE